MGINKYSSIYLKCLSLVLIFCTVFVKSGAYTFLDSTTNILVKIAIESFNRTSPTNHTYRRGILWGGQTSCPPEYRLYRLELDLEPICEEKTSCPLEKCMIFIRRLENMLTINNGLKQCIIPSATRFVKSFLPRKVNDLVDSDLIDFMDNRTLQHNITVLETDNDSDNNSYCSFCENCQESYSHVKEMQSSLFDFEEIIMKSIDDVRANIFKHKINKVIKTSRTIIRGARNVIYYFNLLVGITNCFKGQRIPRSQCSYQLGKPLIWCSAEIVASARISRRPRILENNCTKSDSYLFGIFSYDSS